MASDIENEYIHWWTSLRPCLCGVQPKVRYVRDKQGTDGWRASFYWLVECPKCGKQGYVIETGEIIDTEDYA